jgi:hypothetical protein
MELIFVIICSLLGWVVFYLKLRSERKDGILNKDLNLILMKM